MNPSTLIEIIKSGTFSSSNTECEFEAHYEDYDVRGVIECEIEESEEKDESVGIMSDSYQLNGVYFFHFEGIDDCSENITLGKRELISVKHDIENYFDGLVQEF